MIISLKINNCFIYDSEVEFSMRANMHYKLLDSNVSRINKTNVLKTAIIIGPNNSGKTNFINVISAVKNIMLNKKNKLHSNLFSDNSICCFEIVFLEKGNEYMFCVKYDSKSREYVYERFSLIKYDSHKNKKVEDFFIRDTEKGVFSCRDIALSSAMKVSSKNNILIHLLDESQFPLLLEIKKIIMSFALRIDVVDMNNIPLKKTIDMIKAPSSTQKKIVNFILNADLFLDDFKYLTDEEMGLETEGFSDDEQNFHEKNSSSFVEMLHLSSVYKGVAVPSVLFDSKGTKKIAALASYVIDSLENGRILIVDELDNSLHFRLTRAIISLFNNELNHNAQLICTVHDVSLLDCQKLFRKEQIWFSHKDRENVYLYSLSEFTSERDKIRDTTSLIQKYKLGVFGALPEPDLFQSLLEVKKDG